MIKKNKALLKLLSADPRSRSSHRKSHKKSKKNIVIISILITLILGSAMLGFTVAVISKVALLETFLTMMSATPFIGEVNIVVAGLDHTAGPHRSDTIMIVHVSPNQRKVSVVAIPRDMIVDVPGIGLTKVNHAFAYGGINLTRKSLENLFGIKLPFYVAININGLAKIIDTLGGIIIDVEKRMYYVDYAGGLFVDLYPGIQRLNGQQAVGYIRFRNDSEGDIGRILRQQKFMKALAQCIISKRNVLGAPKVIVSLLSNISTNMDTRQILGLALSMRQSFDIGNIEMASLPGDPIMIEKVFYIKPNITEIERITRQYLSPKLQNKKILSNWRRSNS